MLILFGWGKCTQVNVQNVLKMSCPHCGNAGMWHAFKRTTWFTLFFVPIIPYRFYRFLHCPTCDRGYELTGPEFEKARVLSRLFAECYAQNVIPESRYIEEFNSTALRGYKINLLPREA